MKQIKLTVKVEQHDDHFSLKLPETGRKMVQEMLEFCFDKRNAFVSFALSPPRRPRSTGSKSQSHHINGHCQQIAMETGMPFDEVKKFIKLKAIDRGYPFIVDKKGEPIKDYWNNLIGISESDSSIEECKLLIDTVHQFAAEWEISLNEG